MSKSKGKNGGLDLTLYPDAKVLGINLPGTEICQFSVAARAVPWKVSIVRRGKGPPTNPKFAQWQKYVRCAARQAMGSKLPHSGAYEIHASFMLVHKAQMPDWTNLIKGTEDALQGVVLTNDRMGRAGFVRYCPDAKTNLAIVRVVAC